MLSAGNSTLLIATCTTLTDLSRNNILDNRIKAFADKSIAASSRRDTDTAIAGVRYRNQVLTQRIPAVEAWLKKNG